MTLSREAMISSMVAQGVPRAQAEAVADFELAKERARAPRLDAPTSIHGPVRLDADPSAPARWFELQQKAGPAGSIAREQLEHLEAPPITVWPVRILIPWSYLVSDNERKEPYLVQDGGRVVARMRLSRKYANALSAIGQLARNKVGECEPYAGPLAIEVRVWVPGNSAHHDIANFCKLVHDALERVVYRNDTWLHDIHWRRCGVDVDAPRAEISLTPLPAS